MNVAEIPARLTVSAIRSGVSYPLPGGLMITFYDVGTYFGVAADECVTVVTHYVRPTALSTNFRGGWCVLTRSVNRNVAQAKLMMLEELRRAKVQTKQASASPW